MNFYKILIILAVLLTGCERVVPALYVGPDTIDKREALIKGCFSNFAYHQDKFPRQIISYCKELAIETYGVAGFMYEHRYLDLPSEPASRISPCMKAKTEKELKVCGK